MNPIIAEILDAAAAYPEGINQVRVSWDGAARIQILNPAWRGRAVAHPEHAVMCHHLERMADIEGELPLTTLAQAHQAAIEAAWRLGAWDIAHGYGLEWYWIFRPAATCAEINRRDWIARDRSLHTSGQRVGDAPTIPLMRAHNVARLGVAP